MIAHILQFDKPQDLTDIVIRSAFFKPYTKTTNISFYLTLIMWKVMFPKLVMFVKYGQVKLLVPETNIFRGLCKQVEPKVLTFHIQFIKCSLAVLFRFNIFHKNTLHIPLMPRKHAECII